MDEGAVLDPRRLAALRSLGDESGQLLHDTVRDFIREAPATFDRLRLASQTADQPTTARLAHRLKGMALLVGAMPLASACEAIERCLPPVWPAGIGESIDAAGDALNLSLVASRRLLAADPGPVG